MTEIGDIKGYNLTFKGQRCVDYNADDDKMFAENWKSNTFTFWSGVEDGEKEIDTSTYGKFEWITTGNRESFDSNGIKSKLWRPDWESNERESMIDGNYFEYKKVNETMDLLHEMDMMLDIHQNEKERLYNKLKLEV